MKRLAAIALAAFFSMGVANCEPAVEPAAGVVEEAGVEAPVIALVNQHRTAAGLSPLTWHGSVYTSARGHSNHMANNLVMTHNQTPGAATGGERLTNAGYSWSTWGENVAAGQPTPEDVTQGWMDSPAHRANIMNPGMVHIGVAASRGTNGVIYWTMGLAAPG